MRIAYGIICHKDPKHIARLAYKLTNNTDNVVFLHVDKKAKEEDFSSIISSPRIYFTKQRVNVMWGGYSSILATIILMREIIAYDDFDRFVLLQGLEYPILSNEMINKFFQYNSNIEFIRAQCISNVNNIKEEHKYRFFYFLDKKNAFFVKVIHLINSVLLKNNVLLKMKHNYAISAKGEKLYIYQGAAQFSLTKDAVIYILNFHDANKKFNKYFMTMYSPDESYFHTIIFNSKFLKNTTFGKAEKGNGKTLHLTELENLSYFEYPSSVRLFRRIEEWPLLRDSGKLYFRKASSDSTELLDYIDTIHNCIIIK